MSQRKKKRSRYFCNCYWCTGTTTESRIAKKEESANLEMKTEIKHYEESNL